MRPSREEVWRKVKRACERVFNDANIVQYGAVAFETCAVTGRPHCHITITLSARRHWRGLAHHLTDHEGMSVNFSEHRCETEQLSARITYFHFRAQFVLNADYTPCAPCWASWILNAKEVASQSQSH